jgi:hypothetical protein
LTTWDPKSGSAIGADISCVRKDRSEFVTPTSFCGIIVAEEFKCPGFGFWFEKAVELNTAGFVFLRSNARGPPTLFWRTTSAGVMAVLRIVRVISAKIMSISFIPPQPEPQIR